MKALNQDDKQNHLNKRQKTNRLLGSVQSKHPKVYGAINQLSRIGITIGNKIDSDLNLRLNQRHISSKYNLDVQITFVLEDLVQPLIRIMDYI